MSRAYRITIKESATREIKGSDEIGTCLEVLEVLPPEQMAELLKKEFESRGYQEQTDGTLVKKEGGITITVNPCTAEVTVRAQVEEQVVIEARKEHQGYDDVGPSIQTVREQARGELLKEIEKKTELERERLQGAATVELEQKLTEIQPELSDAVNKVTREALKQKAQQLGTIKEIAEDEASGSLTIKIEV